MRKFVRKRSSKTGLSPGSLVYTGEAAGGPATVGVFSYNEANVEIHNDLVVDTALETRGPGRVDWLNVNGLHDLDIIEKVGAYFDLHPLTVEDIVSTGQRPKVEFYDHYVFIVLRMLSLSDGGREIHDEQVSLVLGPDYVISFQEQGDDGDVFEPVRERIRQAKGKIRKLGPDYLAYALMDVVVDNYFIILERFSELLEELEERLLEAPTPETLHQINSYKREMLFLRKSVWPLREVLSACQREEETLFTSPVQTYLRDVYDHTIQVIDTVETFRDLLSGLLDLYLSSVSNRMNEVMKVLTIIATIFIPLTFIVGVYGMNFAYMPELEWRWAYPAVWGLIIVVALGLVAYFKRRNWF